MATQIQLRGDTATNWVTANPILAEREFATETDTGFYKIGDGVTAWNSLPYAAIKSLSEADVVHMENQGGTPTSPSVGNLNFYAKEIAGRMMLRQQGPSGLTTPLQPSFFQNFITIISTNTTTSVTSIGNTVTNSGTVSHPVVTPEFGYMANFSSNTQMGTGNNRTLWLRTLGFFYAARVAYPDASYDETGASTGTRTFLGLTSGTLAQSVQTDSPAGSQCGFQRLHVNGTITDDNWHFVTSDGTSTERVDTGLPFLPQKIYDAYIFCGPDGSEIGWRIDNVTDGTSASGSTSTFLPLSSTPMRAVIALCTVNSLARNIRMQRVYVESDR